MASWIEEKAEQIKQREEATRKEREWQIHAAQATRSRGKEVVEKLEEAVRADVSKWNEKFPNQPNKQIDSVGKHFPNGFKVNKTHYPAFSLYVSFDAESNSIPYIVVRNRAVDSTSYEERGVFRMHLAEDGNIYLTRHSSPISFEEASQILLEPLLELP